MNLVVELSRYAVMGWFAVRYVGGDLGVISYSSIDSLGFWSFLTARSKQHRFLFVTERRTLNPKRPSQ